MIDASPIRVHQHAGNGQKDERSGCMVRSRSGLTTKIHALADADSCPIHLKLTAGQAHDGRSAANMAANMFETFRPGRYYWQIVLTTAIVYTKAAKNEEHGAAFAPCQIV